MKSFLIQLIITTLSVGAGAYLLPGVHVDGFLGALITALILGVLNALVRPVLIFLTLPATLITAGLFLFVINAVILLIADSISSSLAIDNFWWALLLGLLVTIINSILNGLARDDEKRKDY